MFRAHSFLGSRLYTKSLRSQGLFLATIFKTVFEPSFYKTKKLTFWDLFYFQNYFFRLCAFPKYKFCVKLVKIGSLV